MKSVRIEILIDFRSERQFGEYKFDPSIFRTPLFRVVSGQRITVRKPYAG